MKEKLRILLIILLIMGVFFRFVNLEGKSYWIDEVFTSLRISGYTQAEVIQEVSQGQVISLDELQKYQRPNPEKGVSGTIQGLALEEPQIPPLFFVMARFWTQIFGHSPAITRGFSSLISLLAFPAVYLLCNELFVLPLTGWMAMVLVALSPFQILYAREARNYGLWAVIILLSSWSLLKAIRIKKISNWAIYATTVAVGFYAHLFFALVAIGHGIYVLAIQNFRWTKTITAYLLSSLLGVLAFIPWIWIVINYSASITNTTGWQSQRKSLLSLIITWVGNISRAFLDLGVNSSAPLIYQIPLSVVILFIVSLVAYSLYFLVKTTPKTIWLFVITLIATPALALILPDLLFGGYRSAMSRYLMSCQLGILIAVAYLLANKISFDLLPRWQKQLWQICGVILISSAVLSGIVGSQAETWWNMAYGYQFAPVAKIINQAKRPLVITEVSGNNLGNLLALSYSLKPDVRFQFFPENAPFPQIASGFSERFIYGDSDKSFQQLAQSQNLQRVPIYQAQQDQKTWLWKLVK
ncbi:MAG: glycosyltransferase family 39 protein [Coleofasciculaceae cyanobacterium]